MKTLVIAVLIVICCLCHHSAGSIASGTLLTSGCCNSHYNPKNEVPMKRIINMGRTPNHCGLKSVVIKTLKWEICVNPELKWVKNRLSKFQELTATTKSPSAP